MYSYDGILFSCSRLKSLADITLYKQDKAKTKVPEKVQDIMLQILNKNISNNNMYFTDTPTGKGMNLQDL